MRKRLAKRVIAFFMSAVLSLGLTAGNFGLATVHAADLSGGEPGIEAPESSAVFSASEQSLKSEGTEDSAGGSEALGEQNAPATDNGVKEDGADAKAVSDGDAAGAEDVPDRDAAGAEDVSAGDAAVQALIQAPSLKPGNSSDIALAARTSEAISVDGILSEGIWSQLESYSVAALADFTISNNACNFATTWDDTFFYVGVTVEDKIVVTEQNGILHDEIYQNDGVEFFVDGDNSKGKSYDKINDYHFYIRHDGLLLIQGGNQGTWGEVKDFGDKMEYKVVLTEKGFSAELAIRWDALGVTPKDGTLVGFAVTNDDNDNLESMGRKEITWVAGQNAGKPETWGTVCLYETRKPVISPKGSPDTSSKGTWDAKMWNFSEYYSLPVGGIDGATVKFASLNDVENFYLGMLIEGAGDSAPFVEVILDGDNTRSGGVDANGYGYILQWEPKAAESWQQLNFAKGNKQNTEGTIKTASRKYDLGNGSYAVVVEIPWSLLTAANEDGTVIRQDMSEISFSIAAGTKSGNGMSNDAVRWTESNAWWGNALDKAATILKDNPDNMPAVNSAPTGTPYFAHSIRQGGSVSGKVNVTDADGDALTYKLKDGFDTAKGSVTVNETTGEWTYSVPDGNFMTAGATFVSFYIIAADTHGQEFTTRIEVKVEHAPTNKTYHVDGDYDKGDSDGSAEKPFKTITAAHDVTNPGDTVIIHSSKVPYGWYSDEEYDANPGLYSTVRNGAVRITRSGLPDAPITYKAAAGEVPVICGNAVWNTFTVSANYIIVDGLRVEGKANEQTYEDAFKAFWGKMAAKDDPEYIASWDREIGAYNTNGIGVSPAPGCGMENAEYSIPHHITIRNCVAEYLNGSGIGGSECDYVTFENCTVMNNGWWGMYGSSGLGFIKLAEIDDNRSDYKIKIVSCISAGYRHFIPWMANTVRLSDGNGIIMDTCDDHEHSYKGKMLIANNLVYENGGSGIHTFRSDNVDIINNTVFNNGATPELGWSEVFANDSENINIYNNIIYSRTGNKEDPAQSASKVNTVSYDNNLFYNYRDGSSVGNASTGVTVGAGNLYGADPMFKSVKAVAFMPEGFDTAKDYPADWYKTKTADVAKKPNAWTIAGNAKAAGWYPNVSYDAKTYGYDFELQSGSPVFGKASAEWQAKAGGAAYDNRIGIFSEVGANIAGPVVEKPEENYPFPHNVSNGEKSYKYGKLPDRSLDEMNAAMLKMYERWREIYLTTEGCGEGELRVSGGTSYQMGTCSEGTGYGMLFSVYMANSENNAHEDFDALYRFVKKNLIDGCGLMKWKIDKNGKAVSDWSAPDGDLDIAFALLMADRQWGSDGEINYLEEAKTFIDNLMKYAVNIPQYTIARAQLTNPDKHYLSNTMTSYQIPGHARLFGEVTGDAEWSKVVDGIYGMFKYFSELNPETGLPPYNVDVDTFGPYQGKAYTFSYDACRVPWRITMDYLWNGRDKTGLSEDYPKQMATWFTKYMESINWDFDQVNATFALDGTPKASYASPRNIVGMMAPAAMVGESNQELLDKAYDYLSSLDMTHDYPGDYYQDILVMLGMMAITGNMPNLYTIKPHPDNKMPETVETDTVAPTKPENFRVVEKSLLSDQEFSISFAWEPSTDDSGKVLYSVYRDEYIYYAPLNAGTEEAPCTVRFLDSGKTYQFKVVAQDEAGNKVESDVITVKAVIDKSRLQSLYDENANLEEEDYTAETWKDFNAAMTTAGEVLADAKATQKTIDSAYETLNDALKKLVKKPEPSAEPSTEPTTEPSTEPTVEYKVAVENGISRVPQAFESIESLNTPEKIETQMKLNIQKQGIASGNIAVYDVTLMVNVDGTGWKPVGKEDFPKDGLTMTLEYPEGTGMDTHDFVVCHLFTEDMNGYKAGEAEYPEVTKTKDGIRFTVHGLSPISVGWKPVPVSDDKPNSQEPTSGTGQDTAQNSPKTSDNSHIGWYILAMVISLILIGVIQDRRNGREDGLE